MGAQARCVLLGKVTQLAGGFAIELRVTKPIEVVALQSMDTVEHWGSSGEES